MPCGGQYVPGRLAEQFERLEGGVWLLESGGDERLE
jgi:hypothetical protein